MEFYTTMSEQCQKCLAEACQLCKNRKEGSVIKNMEPLLENTCSFFDYICIRYVNNRDFFVTINRDESWPNSIWIGDQNGTSIPYFPKKTIENYSNCLRDGIKYDNIFENGRRFPTVVTENIRKHIEIAISMVQDFAGNLPNEETYTYSPPAAVSRDRALFSYYIKDCNYVKKMFCKYKDIDVSTCTLQMIINSSAGFSGWYNYIHSDESPKSELSDSSVDCEVFEDWDNIVFEGAELVTSPPSNSSYLTPLVDGNWSMLWSTSNPFQTFKKNLITALSNADYIITDSKISVTQCIKNDLVYSFNYFKGAVSQDIVICLETSNGIIPPEFILIVGKLIQVAAAADVV